MAFATKEQARKYQRDRFRRRRAEHFKDRECYFCGETDMSKLCIHHRDPTQKESHKIFGWSKERLDAEMKKCVIMCRACHAKIHGLMDTKPMVHGTLNAYTEWGCRCPECKARFSQYQKEKRERQQSKLMEQ